MAAKAPIEVPIISIDRDPAIVGRDVDEILREVGFFQIVDHGISDSVADSCWNISRAFFDLPIEEKLKVERTPGLPYGYFPMKSESLAQSMDGMAPGDLKESFNVGPLKPLASSPVDQGEAALWSPNRWPEFPTDFRQSWEAYFDAMSRLSDRLMSIFALGLSLPSDYFADKIDKSPTALRAINYPEHVQSQEAGQLRAGQHTDYGTLTILRQELGQAGLQVRDDTTSSWVDIPPVAGAYVLNIGDLMARWTNDRWTSTLHRVINPDEGSTVSTRRQSVPFFHSANYSTIVEALPSCVSATNPPKYEPVIAGPHLAGKSQKSVVSL